MACQVAFVALVAHFLLEARGSTPGDVLQALDGIPRDKLMLCVIALLGAVVLATQFLGAITWLACAAVFGLTAAAGVLAATVYHWTSNAWVRGQLEAFVVRLLPRAD